MCYCKRHKWLAFLCSGRNSGKFDGAGKLLVFCLIFPWVELVFTWLVSIPAQLTERSGKKLVISTDNAIANNSTANAIANTGGGVCKWTVPSPQNIFDFLTLKWHILVHSEAINLVFLYDQKLWKCTQNARWLMMDVTKRSKQQVKSRVLDLSIPEGWKAELT